MPADPGDLELALIDETDHASARRERLQATDHGDDGQPHALPDERRPSLASFIARGAAVVMLAIPAMLIVAFGIAVAAR